MSDVPTMLVGELLLMKERDDARAERDAAVAELEAWKRAQEAKGVPVCCPDHPSAGRIIHCGKAGSLSTCDVCGRELRMATLIVGKLTHAELAESKHVSDLLHPVGRCTCCGEGSCSFCQLICQLCFGGGCTPEEPTCSGCNGNGWANGVYPPGADGKVRP